VPASGRYHALNLIAAERLGQDVVTTAIEHLGPQMIVGGAGGDDQLRRTDSLAQNPQQLPPTPARCLGVSNHDVNPFAIQVFQSGLTVAGLDQPPPGIPENLMDQ
jgi:hypothetical protein